MFKWYKQAAVCVVYLSDCHSSFVSGRPRWFTGGWTLQELIAPRAVVFYNARWERIGRKDEMPLIDQISSLTRVPKEVLRNTSRLCNYPGAQKMSWAAKRKTSKEEDIAYCLIGIFDVYMPAHYGEGGEVAFRRLQEAIINRDPTPPYSDGLLRYRHRPGSITFLRLHHAGFFDVMQIAHSR